MKMKENLINIDIEQIKQEYSKFSKIIPLIQFAFAMVCFSLSTTFNKILKTTKNDYNEFSFVFLRFTFLGILNLYAWNKSNENAPIMDNIDRKWNVIRIFTVFFAFTCTAISINYLRLSTVVCLLMMHPIWTNILSIIILKEKFEPVYAFGGLMCFLGTILMSLNERKASNNINPKPEGFVIIGVLLSFCSSLIVAFQTISVKVLSQKYNSYYLNYIMGFNSAFLSFFFGYIFTNSFISNCFDIYVILYSFLNSIVSFFAFHYCNISIKQIEFSKITMLTYIQILVSVLAGYLIFDEMIYLLDIIGTSLIVGFNIYSVFMISKEK